MILYVTKETFERFKLKMPEDMQSKPVALMAQNVLDSENGDRFLEWGGKLFYFDRRKCLQVVHFASKLTFFLVDIKVAEMEHIGDLIALYLFDLYDGDKQMKRLLERYFADHPMLAFAHLKDKSAIATLNRTQRDFLDDGYRLYEFVENNILQTRKVNKMINREWIFTRQVDGKTDYFESGELFAKQLKERYQRKKEN